MHVKKRPEPGDRAHGIFSSLRHRKFALFFWSQLASASGEWVQLTALNLLVLRLHGGGRELAFVNLAALLPLLLLTPIAGASADAYDKIRLLGAANVGLVVTSAVLGVLTQTHVISLPLIYVVSAISGCLGAFDVTVRQALVGDLIPLEDLANGIGLNVTSQTAARVLGPLGTAVFVPFLGVSGAFYVNAATYVALLIALPWLRVSRNDVAMRFIPRASLRGGVLAVWRDRSFRLPLLQVGVLSGFGVTSTVLLPLLVIRTLHAPGTTYAVLAGVVGLGSLIGSMSTAARRIVGRRPVAVCALGLAVMLTIVGRAPSVAVAVVPLFLSGVLAACALATALATMQIDAAPELRGRVVAAYAAVFTVGSALVVPTTGLIAEATSPRVAYYLCAVVVAASGILALRSRRSISAAAPSSASPRTPTRSITKSAD